MSCLTMVESNVVGYFDTSKIKIVSHGLTIVTRVDHVLVVQFLVKPDLKKSFKSPLRVFGGQSVRSNSVKKICAGSNRTLMSNAPTMRECIYI